MFWAVFSYFLPYLRIGCAGEGGSSKGLVHNLLMQFFTLGGSKIEVFETLFLIPGSPKMTIRVRKACFRGYISVFYHFWVLGAWGRNLPRD